MSTYGQQRRIPERIRRAVLARDVVCQLQYDCCLGDAVEIDHVISVAELGIDHPYLDDPDNLRGVCRPCHARRTEAQKLAGIQASAARRRDRLKRPSARSTAKHPGDW